MDSIKWKVTWEVKKYRGTTEPYEVIEGDGNLLMSAGAGALWQRLIGTSVTAFDNANAYIGVGTSIQVATPDQTDLIGTSFRQGMEVGYPDNSEGDVLVFQSKFGANDANFTWNEWGIFNASTDGIMLNRKVVPMGTKESPEEWTLTVRIGLQ